MMRAEAASWTPGRRTTSWRGAVSTVIDKGTYLSGTRISRCNHRHRSEAAAVRCARTWLLAQPTETDDER